MNIVTVPEGKIAFTAGNLPGFDKDNPANDDQVKAHVQTMNARAEALAITTRYEVK